MMRIRSGGNARLTNAAGRIAQTYINNIAARKSNAGTNIYTSPKRYVQYGRMIRQGKTAYRASGLVNG